MQCLHLRWCLLMLIRGAAQPLLRFLNAQSQSNEKCMNGKRLSSRAGALNVSAEASAQPCCVNRRRIRTKWYDFAAFPSLFLPSTLHSLIPFLSFAFHLVHRHFSLYYSFRLAASFFVDSAGHRTEVLQGYVTESTW